MYKCMLLSQKTDVKESRKSAFSMLHCTTVWSFNQKSLEEKCSTIESAKKSKTIKKVTGQKHVQIFGKYIYDLKSGTSKAKAMSTLISGSLFFKT